MITVNVGVIFLMALGLVVFVGEPLVRKTRSQGLPDVQEPESERLTLQKEVLYTAIRDLDFDFHMHKVDRQDYTELRQQLEREAVQVLRQIDAVDPLAQLDDVLERQIAAFRQQQMPTPASSDSEVCVHCRARLQGGESFCPTCGQRLGVA
jgi:hypothetical protein